MSVFDDSSPGVFTIMVGFIVVVMGGVALSLMVDHRFQFSQSTKGLEREVATGSTELDRLKTACRDAAYELSSTEPLRRKLADADESKRKELAVLGQRRTTLSADLKRLGGEVAAIEEEFARYQEKYRSVIWAAAEGESLGNIRIRGGREYHQVVITRVSDVGLEVQHEHGIARIHAPDLDPALQDRFQWDDEGRKLKLEKEAAHRKAFGNIPAANVEPRPVKQMPVRRKTIAPRPNDAELKALRGNVIVWKTKVAQIRSDRSAALSAVSARSGSSVPGSLETWQARATRLGVDLAKAESRLAAAKFELSKVAPNDPLLRPPRRGE